MDGLRASDFANQLGQDLKKKEEKTFPIGMASMAHSAVAQPSDPTPPFVFFFLFIGPFKRLMHAEGGDVIYL